MTRMTRAAYVGLLCWLMAGCTTGSGGPDATAGGTERVVLEVDHDIRWRELRIEGTTDLADGAVLSYRVTHAVTDEVPVDEWPSRNLISDGTAVVQDGRYWARLNTRFWPRGNVRVRVEFPVAPQPDAVRLKYGEFGERLTGDNVIALGSSQVVSVEHAFEWTR